MLSLLLGSAGVSAINLVQTTEKCRTAEQVILLDALHARETSLPPESP